MTNAEELYQRAIEVIRSKSNGASAISTYETTINFHPDRFTNEGEPLLVAIGRDNGIKSQFETQTSNGGLSAFRGGERWKWEQSAFDGTYDYCKPIHRPKYGALNYTGSEVGASPRFGSAFFRLKSEVSKRITFCFPDSFYSPKDFATYQYLDHLIDLASCCGLDKLDNYIEAHVHGELCLNRDISAIVLDPCFLGTAIEQQARALPVELQWHSGFRICLDTVERHASYRGSKYVQLARSIAQEGQLTPAFLGDAINDQGRDPQDI